MTECDQYRGPRQDDPGRLYELCVGRSFSARPVTLEDANRWRAEQGLSPLAALSDSSPLVPAPRVAVTAPIAIPGTMLKERLESLDISPHDADACGCLQLANRMNAWGVAGCRDRLAEIAQELRDKSAHYTLLQKAKAATYAVVNGVAFQLNPLDPFPGLVTEAIRRAEHAMNPSPDPTASPDPPAVYAEGVQQHSPGSRRIAAHPGAAR